MNIVIIAIVSRAREQRVQRLKQASVEAEQSVSTLRKQLQQQFDNDIKTKGNDSTYANELKSNTNKELKSIDDAFNKNKDKVLDVLLHHVTTVTLDVSEALRQSLIMKNAAGLNK